MASGTASLELHTQFEDVLAYLPISGTTEYAKGRIIYSPGQPSQRIYLVISGKVGISQITDDGHEMLLEIVPPDELFGESAFLDLPRGAEQATAIETASLMSWAVSDLEDLLIKRPRLAIALLQVAAQRNANLTRHIGSLATETIERRLARSLIRFSERLGTTQLDGTVRMMPFTHVLLSQYVGTTREVITHYMNRFRKQGYVSYSRQSIQVHRETFKSLLDC